MQTFSAPMAYIKIGNETAGFVRNITVQEQINRVDVQGLGSLPIQQFHLKISFRCEPLRKVPFCLSRLRWWKR